MDCTVRLSWITSLSEGRSVNCRISCLTFLICVFPTIITSPTHPSIHPSISPRSTAFNAPALQRLLRLIHPMQNQFPAHSEAAGREVWVTPQSAGLLSPITSLRTRPPPNACYKLCKKTAELRANIINKHYYERLGAAESQWCDFFHPKSHTYSRP